MKRGVASRSQGIFTSRSTAVHSETQHIFYSAKTFYGILLHCNQSDPDLPGCLELGESENNCSTQYSCEEKETYHVIRLHIFERIYNYGSIIRNPLYKAIRESTESGNTGP
eukprot:sb/3477139/